VCPGVKWAAWKSVLIRLRISLDRWGKDLLIYCKIAAVAFLQVDGAGALRQRRRG